MELKNIHLALAEARKEKGISQTDLAGALNIEQATLSMYESNKRGIPLDILDRWLKALDIKVTITHNSQTPVKPAEEAQDDLESFNGLKKRRNFLVAELRSLAASFLAQISASQDDEAERDSELFWAYAHPYSNEVKLTETRFDHPSQKHLAVEYTGTEVNVYRFLAAPTKNEKSDQEWLGVNRDYFSEDDLLLYGQQWDPESLEDRKRTVFRANPYHPDGIELIDAEGFSVRSLVAIQENFERFIKAYETIESQTSYRDMHAELMQIEDKLVQLRLDNRLWNGQTDPAFDGWTEADLIATNVPLNSGERSWFWEEEGVKWKDVCSEPREVSILGDSIPHEGYPALRDENGNRIVGLIGNDLKPALFKRNPLKPDVLYRVEVDSDELSETERDHYEKTLESTRLLEDLRRSSPEQGA